LDVLINWKTPLHLGFSIYKKPTHNPKYIHWYSNHSQKIKMGVIITLTLRALRICSSNNLKTEINSIIETFKKLAYPINIIYKSINKAKKTFIEKENNSNTNNNKFIKYQNTLALNTHINLKIDNLNIVTKYSNTLKKQMKPIITNNIQSGIYGIPCVSCNKSYFGETCDLGRRKYQHSYDMRTFNRASPLISHLETQNHLIKVDNFTTLKYIRDYNFKKFYESFIIKNSSNFNRDPGYYKIDNITNHYLKQSNSCKNITHILKEWSTKNNNSNQPIHN
jgi:hypothetical protein